MRASLDLRGVEVTSLIGFSDKACPVASRGGQLAATASVGVRNIRRTNLFHKLAKLSLLRNNRTYRQ